MSEKRKAAFVLLLAVFCAGLYFVFPKETVVEMVFAAVMFLAVLPLLCGKVIWKTSLSDYGLRKGDPVKGAVWAAAAFFLTAVSFLLLLKYTALAQGYVVPNLIREHFSLFVVYEILVVGVLVAVLEFFLRGFVVCQLRDILGLWTVLLQFVVLILFIQDLGDWNSLQLTLASVPAALTAYYSRSIYYSLPVSLAAAVLMDAAVIAAG